MVGLPKCLADPKHQLRERGDRERKRDRERKTEQAGSNLSVVLALLHPIKGDLRVYKYTLYIDRLWVSGEAGPGWLKWIHLAVALIYDLKLTYLPRQPWQNKERIWTVLV